MAFCHPLQPYRRWHPVIDASMTADLPQTSYDTLQQAIGYRFKDSHLLLRALTHKSVFAADQGHYERLEFLGDRVLGLVISDALYSHFREDDQGALTKRFHALVQQGALAEIAHRLELQKLIITDASGQASQQESVLADVIEALIAAIYIDGGLAEAKRFIFAYLDITKTTKDDGEANPKSALQEWAMGQKLPLPDYRVIAISGPDHAPTFLIEISLSGYQPIQASGGSKKEAEQKAARQYLKLLKQEASS